VDIDTPFVLINGERLTTPLIFETMSEKKNGYSGYFRLEDIGFRDENIDISLPLTLEPDEYFILGDNSERSIDNRMRKPISRADIIGRAIRIYYPFSRFRELE
jgi:hypothetical protein